MKYFVAEMIGGFMSDQSGVERREEEVNKRIKKHKYKSKLYHYTSISSLIGILSKKELWLGNTANMNDKKEMVDFIEKLQNAVSKDINLKKTEKCNLFFAELYSKLKNEYPFAISFSTLNDNAAQWERYADNACGACIIFNTSRLLNLFWYNGAFLHEVFYQYNIKKHPLYGTLRDYFITEKLKNFDNEEEMRKILGCAYLYKHESFNTESEIRLSTIWYQKIKESKFAFEMVNGKLKKILKISLDKLCLEEGIDIEELIEGIVIGPRSEQNESELSEYLETLGYKKISKNITRSQCPLG